MDADDFFFADIPEDAPMAEEQKAAIVLSGHGNVCDDPPIFRVPTGFTLHFWSEPGTTIIDSYAGLIEKNPSKMHLQNASESYSRGTECRNYFLSDPKGLSIQQTENPMHRQLIPSAGETWKLNELMDDAKKAGRGDADKPVDIHWCACRGAMDADKASHAPSPVSPDISAMLKPSGSSDAAATSPRADSAESSKILNRSAVAQAPEHSTQAAGIFHNVFAKHNVNFNIIPTAEDSRSYRDPNHIGVAEAIAHGYGSASVNGTHVQAKGHFDVEANAFDARGTFSDGPIKGSAEFQVGMSAQGDAVFEADPNNGTLVASVSGSVFVGEKASLMLSEDINGFKVGQSIDQAAGAMANGNTTMNFDPTHGSIGAGGYGSAFAGASVHTGANIGGGGVTAGAGIGYLAGVGGMAGGNIGIKEGKLDVALTLGASLGVGLNIDIQFGIDFNQIGDEIHAAEIAHAFQDFGDKTKDGFDTLGSDLLYCVPVFANWADVGGDAINNFGNDIKDGLQDFGQDLQKGCDDFGSAFRHAFNF